MSLTGREKATIFLSILGAETSAKVLRLLPEELADLIAEGINHLPAPSPEAIFTVLKELKSSLTLPKSSPQPILEQKNEREITLEAGAMPLEVIQAAAPRKLAALLLYEKSQIVAYLLSFLSPEKRLDVLNNLPSQRREIEDLLKNLHPVPATQKIEAKLLELWARKLS